MIHTEDLSKNFDGFLAVDGVNLDVPAGNILVLLGPNGAGKTTTVRMLTSILVPSRGWASINGFNVVTHPEKVRSSVGVLTEQHSLYNRMNAVEYLTFFGMLYGMKGSILKERISQLLEYFNLAQPGQKRIAEYSKGMRQKLSLARAIIHNPPVLLLDEPTSAMDPQSAQMVRNMIIKLRSSERTILLCTHNLVEADELADEIAIIHRGKIIAHDTPHNLKKKLLGKLEFVARFTKDRSSYEPPPLPGVVVTGQGKDWMRFMVENPRKTNPKLIWQLLVDQFDLVSFSETRRTLEQAYLEAISDTSGETLYD